MIPYVLFHSFDVFTIILENSKKIKKEKTLEWGGVLEPWNEEVF